VLVLDEPTNHLDLEAIHALVEAVKAYTGTVIFVSHDRWFVSELATRIVELTAEGPRDFPGTYAEYLARCGDDHLDADAVASKARLERRQGELQQGGRKNGGARSGAAVDATWEDQKKQRNRMAQLPKQRDRLLAQIEAAEGRKKAIADLYYDPGFFQRTSLADIDALEKEQAELGPKIDSLVAEWEALERELAAITAD
jgi:energy-coupling factor transporter ATP-binding protein EcfA2